MKDSEGCTGKRYSRVRTFSDQEEERLSVRLADSGQEAMSGRRMPKLGASKKRSWKLFCRMRHCGSGAMEEGNDWSSATNLPSKSWLRILGNWLRRSTKKRA